MAVLVTGGAGFIGSHLVERLLTEGEEVVVIDSFNDYYPPQIKRNNIKSLLPQPKFKLIEGDIRDRDCLNKIFQQEEITQIVHLAARAGVRNSLVNPQLYNDVNVIGTVNLLECCKEYGIKKIVFGSSSSVYGVSSQTPFTEDDPLLHPISPYAVTKISGERLCSVYHKAYGISAICLRFFTVYGPRQRPEMAIHKFVRLIDQEKPIPFYGDGSSARDYTFITDIIDGIRSAMKKDIGFEIFNLGDSRTINLRELVTTIENLLNKKAKLDKLPIQPGDVPITYASLRKVTPELGYQPKVNIEEGLEIFVKWYLDNKYN